MIFQMKKKNVFIPVLHLDDDKKMKLMILYINEIFLYLFFDENFEINKPNQFDQIAENIEICFKDNFEKLQKINFEDKMKDLKKDIDFVYYNKHNKSLKLSNMFFIRNSNELDKSKIHILERIKELIFSNRIKKSVTKFDGIYLYFFEQFEKNIIIILREYKTIEEVKVKYLNKLLKTIEYY